MKTQHDYWQEDHDRTIEEMKLDPMYGAVPPGDSAYTFRNTHNPNTITCMAGGEEMLRVASDGFWVRGKQVKQDDNEAETVYNAFKTWMIWAQLNRDYK
jgi:hypothetical protein